MTTALAQEFAAAVARAAEGTPYVVRPDDEGFSVALDVVDARWIGLLNAAGLQKAYVHHVRVRDDRSYTITDDARTVEWVAGTPRIAASAERQVGRVIEFGHQTVWAFDEHGRFGVQADFQFDSEEGRDLINGVAGQLGLQLRRGGIEKGAIAIAALTLGGLLVGGVVAVVLLLLGYR
ncbi:hypothetical protein [Nocardioides ferulae]|uniref:hypothetical protein n=1 Tax=Nocardioides ferulae TaxID=2340821 RepID=UPI000EB3FBEA|nr:hypothetical protein [Nocardioides ferulae]